ncbi:MAG: hypothetical protein V3U24_09945 [Candidatus Neomarinimicrobiota bacterium]
MKSKRFYKGMFMVAAWYDFILGIVFFFFYKGVYSLFDIRLPDQPAYLHTAAAFVFAQGLLYYFVYLDLERNVDIAKVGIVYKLVYTGVAFYYWAIGGLPHPMFALFGFLDLVFVVLFVLYLKNYRLLIAALEPEPPA